MIAFLLLLLFLAVTLFFGFVFSAAVLGERRLFALLPLGILIGIGGYVFFVNLISYAIPFSATVWLVLFLMLSSAIALSKRAFNSADRLFVSGGPETRQLRLLFGSAFLISAVSGIVALRTLQYDDLSLSHLPLAATIVEGNFPVMDPSAPGRPMPYHYVSEIFTAALHKITGTPLWLGYDIQTFLMSGAVFLAAFLLAFHLRPYFKSAFLAALLLFYGGGLSWLYLTEGIRPLWNKYILGQEVFAPWRFVASMTIPKLRGGFVFLMEGHAVEIGLAVTLLVFYLYLRSLASQEPRWFFFSIAAGIFLGYLALTYETTFVILLGALVLVAAVRLADKYLVIAGLVRREFLFLSESGNFFKSTAIIFLLSAPLALYQGGVLSSFGTGGSVRLFSVNWRFWLVDFFPGEIEPFALWSWTAFVELGLAPLLIVPAVVFYRRNRHVLFLALTAASAFFATFMFRYSHGPGETRRLLGSLAIPLFSFIIGLFLGELWEHEAEPEVRRSYQRFAVGAAFLLMSSSLLFQFVYLLTPLGHVGKFRRPFLEIPRARSPLDERAYRWIRENTTLADRFFPYDKNGTNFVRETGRFVPAEKNVATLEPHPENKRAYGAVLERCDATGFRDMQISHIYVSPDFPQGDFEKNCIPRLNARLVYEEVAGDDFRRIYRWNNLQ